MKARRYTPNCIPHFSDIPSYRDKWVAWWTSLQPPWRQGRGWPLPRDHPEEAHWLNLGVHGRSGLFLVIISTAFWATSIQSVDDWVEFDRAVDDIAWVINQILGAVEKLLPIAQPMPPNTPPDASQEQAPSKGGEWMIRETGKRTVKPSRKMKAVLGG